MWRAAVVGLVACGDGTVPPVDVRPDPAERFAIDVVVDQAGVRVYLVGLDRAPCTPQDDRFPMLGACTAIEDYNTCVAPEAEPCAHRDVALVTADETRQAAYTTGQTTWFAFDTTMHPEAELAIAGCGGEARIPLGSTPLATPTASARREVDGTVTVTWNGAPATHALLELASFGGMSCLTMDSPYVFATPPAIANSPYLELSSYAFSDPAMYTTALGTVRVWRGGVASGMVPP